MAINLLKNIQKEKNNFSLDDSKSTYSDLLSDNTYSAKKQDFEKILKSFKKSIFDRKKILIENKKLKARLEKIDVNYENQKESLLDYKNKIREMRAHIKIHEQNEKIYLDNQKYYESQIGLFLKKEKTYQIKLENLERKNRLLEASLHAENTRLIKLQNEIDRINSLKWYQKILRNS